MLYCRYGSPQMSVMPTYLQKGVLYSGMSVTAFLHLWSFFELTALTNRSSDGITHCKAHESDGHSLKLASFSALSAQYLLGWRRGVVVSGVRQWTKLTHVGPGYSWDWWPSSGVYTISGCNQPTRSTQPCIPPESLNRVPASAGVTAGASPLPGGR